MNPRMKQTLRSIYDCVDRLGFDPLTGAANLREVPNFAVDQQAIQHADTERHRTCKPDGAPAASDGWTVPR